MEEAEGEEEVDVEEAEGEEEVDVEEAAAGASWWASASVIWSCCCCQEHLWSMWKFCCCADLLELHQSRTFVSTLNQDGPTVQSSGQEPTAPSDWKVAGSTLLQVNRFWVRTKLILE